MAKRRKSIENRILDSYESGALVSTTPSGAELRSLRAAAQRTLAKDRRINIRLSSPVLLDLQARAAEEGLPYQTLIASVLHKYVTGRLVESPSRAASDGRAGWRRATRSASRRD